MTYDQWFRSQQGIAYEGSYLFAEAAWEHQAERIRALEVQHGELQGQLCRMSLRLESTDDQSVQFGDVIKQRDELLAALEAGRRLIELISPFEGDVTRQIDKAIERVKGGAA